MRKQNWIFCGYLIFFTYGCIGQIDAGGIAPTAASFPVARGSLQSWQTDRKIGLTPAAQALVSGEFADAARQTANESGASDEDIDAASRTSVYDYLDRNTTSAATVASLKTLLSAQHGLRGDLGASEPKRLGRIKITYSKQIDTLRVAAQNMPPWPEILSEIGPVDIEGLIRGRVVCRRTVSVSPVTEVSFSC